jgi:hypothetical protein
MNENQTEPKFGKLYLGCVDYEGADIRIGHRDDALALLDELIEAESVKDIDIALAALRDAIARGIV